MLHLGSIGGTTLRVDPNFFLLIVFFVVATYDPQLGMKYSLLWVPVLFVSVLVHELAHAAMIAIFGYGASDVILGGMGGVTINQRQARPWHDMLISLAGPASSFAMGFGAVYLFRGMPAVRQDPFFSAIIPTFASANFFWGQLNLVPMNPLDGGHAVRNFFRMFLTERKAFVIAVWIGMIGGAAAAVFYAMGRQIFLTIFIAWLVYVQYQAWLYFQKHGVPGD